MGKQCEVCGLTHATTGNPGDAPDHSYAYECIEALMAEIAKSADAETVSNSPPSDEKRVINAITILQAQCDARDKELDEIREALAKALAKPRHVDDTMAKLKTLIQTGWLLSPDPAPPTPGEGDRGPLDWGLPGDWEFKGYDLFNPHSSDHMSDERWIREPTLEETVTRAYDVMQGVDDAGN